MGSQRSDDIKQARELLSLVKTECNMVGLELNAKNQGDDV
jgi:hypothetical protein